MPKDKKKYVSPIRLTEQAHSDLFWLKELYTAKSASDVISKITLERRGKLNGVFLENRTLEVIEDLSKKFGSTDLDDLILTLGEMIEAIEEEDEY